MSRDWKTSGTQYIVAHITFNLLNQPRYSWGEAGGLTGTVYCDNVSSEILIVLLDFVSRRGLVGDMVVGRFPINWRGLYYDSAGVRVTDRLRRGKGYRVGTWWGWR